MNLALCVITPAVVLLLSGSLMYLAGAFVAASARVWSAISVLVIGIAAAGFFTCSLNADGVADISLSVVVLDELGVFGTVITLCVAAALSVISITQAGERGPSEYFASLMIVASGGVMVAVSNDLILLFLSLELISIPTYVLLYLPRNDSVAREATAKYFFLSIMSSAIFLYGLSFLYGAVGSTNLSVIPIGPVTQATASPDLPPATFLIALLFIVAGLSFKIAAVPFHTYAPDVYEGSTHALAATLAWAPKAAGIMALMRVATFGMETVGNDVAWLMWVIAAATMTTGNVMGLLQRNLRRLLAYSSIAHTGYLVLGLGAASIGGVGYLADSGAESVLFYLVAYALMTVGLFSAFIYLSTTNRSVESIDDLSGLCQTHPGIAFSIAVFLFSLTGIPITAGFWGKFALFSSALSADDLRYKWLAVIGVINAAISSYYYLRIISTMYMKPCDKPLQSDSYSGARFVTYGCAVAVLVVGIYPAPVVNWVSLSEKPVPVVGSVIPSDPIGTGNQGSTETESGLATRGLPMIQR